MKTHVVTITKKMYKKYLKHRQAKFYCEHKNEIEIDDLVILKIVNRKNTKYRLTLPYSVTEILEYYNVDETFDHTIAVVSLNLY